jgi:acyl-CoA synthetase (AMP-forming)/AMP-acid ligase II
MKGYLNNERATAETIKLGNWLHSGDIAYYDESSRFYIVDRLKELIKVKGFQVAPAELEDLIRSHSDVIDVAVIGIPDKLKGELPLAFIVVKEDVKNKNLVLDSVHKFVNEHVAEYKKLAGGIKIVDSIPKSASGKILRKDLRALFTKMNEK